MLQRDAQIIRDGSLLRTAPESKESLLQLHGWKEVMDGRGSEAMLRLLVSLRELHQLGWNTQRRSSNPATHSAIPEAVRTPKLSP
jgi:hypothetical protein